MTPATHYGRCQFCNSLQKLPGGVLAKHGYSVAYGFFSGVCRGSGYKPIEVSCGQVERYLAEARGNHAGIVNKAAILRQLVADGVTRAWVHHYFGSDRVKGGHRWIEVDLTEKIFGSHSEFTYIAYSWRFRKDVEVRIESHQIGYAKSMVAAVTALNTKRAAFLDGRAARVLDYIRWQEARLNAWKAAPERLVEVKSRTSKAKDTERFDAGE